jgi:formylglycine-generating enzyme required for sulfatase activity
VDEPDSTDAVLQYLDADGDGFGAGFPLLSCDTLDNHVLVEGDCNDGMATVNPAATEVCNGIDDDCSGTVDVGAVDPVTYHLDADSDGHGDPTISVESCPDFDPVTQLPGIPIGLSLLSDDCNDADASVSPSANELCTTTLDENCDGDPVYNAVDPSLYVLDFDQDGYGTFDNSFQACQAYFPYLLWTTDSLEDCDDFDPLVLPGQDPDFELCNGKLDRCEQDDGNLTPPPEELDDDGDGFVDCSLDVDPSVWGNGTILGGDDCDDQDSGVYPLAMERCNGIFDDCISRVGVVTAPEDELDDDGDGQVECPYFDSATWLGDSSVSSGADCDDTDPEIYTGAASSHPSICASDLNLDGYPDCRYGSVCDHVLGTGTGQIDFAQIPAGGFQMGSDVLQEGHENDETNHPVTISFDFAMMTTEVTQRAYESVVDSDWTQYGTAFGLGDDQPVYNVSWSMAANFANGLTALHNQQYGTNFRNCYLCSGSGSTILCQEDYDLMFCDGYRLPTEAEWEYATKSGVSNDFWTAAGGADLAPATGADCDAGLVLDDSSVLANFAWFCGTNASDDVQEVGLLDENARGLFDVHGNVWEWTHDAYQYDLGVDPQTDPVFSQGPYRSIRGGAWFSQPTGLRAANRSYALPQMHYHYVGFRLVRRLF